MSAPTLRVVRESENVGRRKSVIKSFHDCHLCFSRSAHLANIPSNKSEKASNRSESITPVPLLHSSIRHKNSSALEFDPPLNLIFQSPIIFLGYDNHGVVNVERYVSQASRAYEKLCGVVSVAVSFLFLFFRVCKGCIVASRVGSLTKEKGGV